MKCIPHNREWCLNCYVEMATKHAELDGIAVALANTDPREVSGFRACRYCGRDGYHSNDCVWQRARRYVEAKP